MTQAELDALPEVQGVALYQPADQPMMVTDASGQSWMLGEYQGQRVKSRMATANGGGPRFSVRIDEQGRRVPFLTSGFVNRPDEDAG